MAKKRRADGAGTIVQRANGTYGAAVSVVLASGKHSRKWVYAKTKKEVTEKLAALKKEVAEYNKTAKRIPEYGSAEKRVTVKAFLDKWLENVVLTRNRPQTYQRYKSLVDHHIAPNIGHIQLAHLTAEDVQMMLNKLSKRLKRNTVSGVRGALHRAFNQAIRWDYLQRNVIGYTDVPGEKTYTSGKVMTPEQAMHFLTTIKGHHLEALFYIALTRGLRRGELLGLRWEDIDLDKRCMYIRNSLVWDKKYTLGTLKTLASKRTLPLSDDHIRLLCDLLAQQQAQMKQDWSETTLLFSRLDGSPLRPRYVHAQFKRILEKAGLPDIRIHDLRHLCATFLIAKGVQTRVVMAVLGHSQVATTLNVYAHVQPDTLMDSVSKLDTFLNVEHPTLTIPEPQEQAKPQQDSNPVIQQSNISVVQGIEQLPFSLAQRLHTAAQRLQVHPNDLASYLLEKALDMLDSGVLDVPTQPSSLRVIVR